MSGANKEPLPFHETSIVNHEDGSITTLRVPVVQELARHGTQKVPEMFIKPTSDTVICCLADDFPCISLAQLRANKVQGKENELKKLANGLKEWGMILVSEHGIPNSLLSSVKEVIKGFFGLSFDEKKRSVGTYAAVDNMGYGRNFVKSDAQALDWIDRLTIKVAPTDPTNSLNVWPQAPPTFREVIESYAEEASKLCDYILQALAEALSLEENAFVKYFDPKTREINARINYYPPCPEPNLTIGLSPHTDATILTLLMQFGATDGLQVLHKDTNVWLRVPWPNDALLINVGDLLEILSNGSVISPWHRAITQVYDERYSFALFFNPPLSMEITPIKSDHYSEYKYKKVVVGDYVHHLYNLSPTPSKMAINFAMV